MSKTQGQTAANSTNWAPVGSLEVKLDQAYRQYKPRLHPVAFQGCCRVKVKHGRNIWAACNADKSQEDQSSTISLGSPREMHNMEMSTGNPAGGPADKKQRKRGVLDQTAGLQGYGLTRGNAGGPQEVKTILGRHECCAYICKVHAAPTMHSQRRSSSGCCSLIATLQSDYQRFHKGCAGGHCC